MRYKVNDINLCYQKDRNCGSLKINTPYGVENKISSTHFTSSSFNNYSLSISNKYSLVNYLRSLSQYNLFSGKEHSKASKDEPSLTEDCISLPTYFFSVTKESSSLVQYLCCSSIKCNNTFQYIVIPQWYNEYPDWFTKQW